MIVQATVEDLPRLQELAEGFQRDTKHLQSMDFEHFCASWSALIQTAGVIFINPSESGRLRGAIGGIAYVDIVTKQLVAVEGFWFVHLEYRGGTVGPRLYSAFEEWARERGCVQIRMVALADSMAEELDKFYLRKGFELVEQHYSRPLQ